MKLQIKVIPSSSKDCIAGWLEDTLKVKVQAPPDRGKANKSVIKVLQQSLGLENGSIRILSGTTSNIKIIEISCQDDDAIQQKLAAISLLPR